MNIAEKNSAMVGCDAIWTVRISSLQSSFRCARKLVDTSKNAEATTAAATRPTDNPLVLMTILGSVPHEHCSELAVGAGPCSSRALRPEPCAVSSGTRIE